MVVNPPDTNGGIAQLARAIGSYPIGRRFESYSRHQLNMPYVNEKLKLFRFETKLKVNGNVFGKQQREVKALDAEFESPLWLPKMSSQLSWIEQRPSKACVLGSNPRGDAIYSLCEYSLIVKHLLDTQGQKCKSFYSHHQICCKYLVSTRIWWYAMKA